MLTVRIKCRRKPTRHGREFHEGARISESRYSKHNVSFRVSNSYFRDKNTRQQFVSNVNKKEGFRNAKYMDFDHTLGNNDHSALNCQWLCLVCHRRKTDFDRLKKTLDSKLRVK